MRSVNINPSFFFFTNNLEEKNKKNILKFKNVAIVYYNKDSSINYQKLIEIKKFCKKHNIKIFISDNFRVAKKYDLNGVVLSNKNYRISIFNNNLINKKKLEIIGKVHSQKDYFFKIRQNCTKIILSPIFKTKDYKKKNILGIVKFNLKSLTWKKQLYALGGININNLNKITMTKSMGVGFMTLINLLENKKSPLIFRDKRAF
jgi:thiamine monophosphate synthase